MSKTLDELTKDAEALLVSKRYTENTVKHYGTRWRKFAKFCLDRGIDYPTEEDGERFVEEYDRLNTPVRSHRHMLSKAIRLLFRAQHGEGLNRMSAQERYCLPDRFSGCHGHYKNNMIAKGLATATVKGRAFQAKRFLWWLGCAGVQDVHSITAGHVYGYVSSIAWMRPQSISDTMFILRGFLSFLCERCGADQSLGNLFPIIHANKNSSLPSVYSTEEISRIISELKLEGRCALRDRAIVLLAAQHGLRVGDIFGLRLCDIDWTLMRIVVTQKKTRCDLSLPLQEESALALIDYLKNERPDSNDTHIFLTHCAPHEPLAASAASLHSKISQLFTASGIDIHNKHHGMHSIRHSLAVNMLESKVPLPVLSGVLGHSSTEATRVYLRVDFERLRPLSLEVPHGR
jgi:site-specific recombinase XerD